MVCSLKFEFWAPTICMSNIVGAHFHWAPGQLYDHVWLGKWWLVGPMWSGVMLRWLKPQYGYKWNWDFGRPQFAFHSLWAPSSARPLNGHIWLGKWWLVDPMWSGVACRWLKPHYGYRRAAQDLGFFGRPQSAFHSLWAPSFPRLLGS